MKRSISLKELPDKYIDCGLTLSGLLEYLDVAEEDIKKWEKIFNVTPAINENNEKIYSKAQVEEFSGIKESLNKGKTLREIRDKVLNNSFEVISNPFEDNQNFSEFKPEKQEKFEKGKLNRHISSESMIRPFLTQLNKVNQKVDELINEKTRLIEKTAIEKADLSSKVEILKNKNESLIKERESIAARINKREEEIDRSFSREENLGKALRISQEVLCKKEDEIASLRTKIEGYQRELHNKESLIYDQSMEIDQLLEKQNTKWWQFWKFPSYQ